VRKLGEPPGTVKGQRAWARAVARIEQYRERYGVTDPSTPSAPNSAAASWSSAALSGLPARRSIALRAGSVPSAPGAGRAAPGERGQPAEQARRARPHQRNRAGRERDAG
jgi:hypothetical protein